MHMHHYNRMLQWGEKGYSWLQVSHLPIRTEFTVPHPGSVSVVAREA